MTEHSMDLLVFAIVVGARLLVPLAIPRFPLPAIVIAMIIDAADQTIFQRTTNLNLDWYQGYDKSLDIYYLAIAYIATMRNWTNLFAYETSRFLWYYRLIGVALFEYFQVRALLFIFPNTFEYFFDFYEGVRTRWDPRRLSKKNILAAAAFIWIFIKLPQEYWLHIAELDVTNFIKEDIFDVPLDTSFTTIIQDNIPFFIGLIALIVGLIFLLRWVMNKYLPEPDWSWTFDSNSHPDADSTRKQPVYQRPSSLSVFDRALVEKIILLSLILAIFSMVLPGVDVTQVQLVVALILLITANTAISEFLSRRGHTVNSMMSEFVAITGINFLLVALAKWLIDRDGGGSMSTGATLFFVLLISLIVTLYDRYHPIYLRRVAAAETATA